MVWPWKMDTSKTSSIFSKEFGSCFIESWLWGRAKFTFRDSGWVFIFLITNNKNSNCRFRSTFFPLASFSVSPHGCHGWTGLAQLRGPRSWRFTLTSQCLVGTTSYESSTRGRASKKLFMGERSPTWWFKVSLFGMVKLSDPWFRGETVTSNDRGMKFGHFVWITW